MKTRNHKLEDGLSEWFEKECTDSDALVFRTKDDIKTILNIRTRKGISWSDSDNSQIQELAKATHGEI